ncbi:hypothetical protein [Candidatus Methylomicrobium oryzae]|uniref:hypothetical protein n=1 Tax=Candidatus Methylomicrobium oryzae TaxID=2802053 RepID=UPI0019217A7C|nr:hypothetical protein [Methylomicrobium sp. RS1]MBL1264926.1 hypothetical protein [Methylomicrobium sp. RS1]
MTTEDFITDLFCPVDARMKNAPNHSQASLWPSELVTIGLLFALKGGGSRLTIVPGENLYFPFSD